MMITQAEEPPRLVQTDKNDSLKLPVLETPKVQQIATKYISCNKICFIKTTLTKHNKPTINCNIYMDLHFDVLGKKASN